MPDCGMGTSPSRSLVVPCGPLSPRQCLYGYQRCTPVPGPAGLAAPADVRSRFQEAELIHSRWAMAGVAGILAVEFLGQGNWISAQTWVRKP